MASSAQMKADQRRADKVLTKPFNEGTHTGMYKPKLSEYKSLHAIKTSI